MRCSTAKRYIDLKLDGELNPRHLPVLTKHLSTCKACQSWQAEAEKLQQMFSNAPAPELPTWIHAQIMDKVHRLDKVRPSFVRRFQLATATAVVAIFFSFLAGTQVGIQTFYPAGESNDYDSVSVSSLSFGENTLMYSYDSSGDTNE